MCDTADPFVEYLESLGRPWPRLGVEAVLTLIRAGGSFEESIKWGHPYFAVGGRRSGPPLTVQSVDFFGSVPRAGGG